MIEFFTRAWHDLVARPDGPLFARIFLQPAVATILAIRAGRRDVAEGREPYLWRVASDPANRPAAIRQGWKDIGTLFCMAFVLDLVYQWLQSSFIYAGESVIVAVILAIVPYVLVRSIVRRTTPDRV